MSKILLIRLDHHFEFSFRLTQCDVNRCYASPERDRNLVHPDDAAWLFTEEGARIYRAVERADAIDGIGFTNHGLSVVPSRLTRADELDLVLVRAIVDADGEAVPEGWKIYLRSVDPGNQVMSLADGLQTKRELEQPHEPF